MQEKDLSGAEERELEGAEHEIDEALMEIEEKGKHEVEISVEEFHGPTHKRHHFRMPRGATLLEVLDKGARESTSTCYPARKSRWTNFGAFIRTIRQGSP